MKVMFVLFYILATDTGDMHYWSQKVPGCPSQEALKAWEDKTNQGLHGSSQQATVWCVQLPYKYPERQA